MDILMSKCPATGRKFSIGIEIECDSPTRHPDMLSKVKCPYCGAEHMGEARLRDLVEPSQLAMFNLAS